MPVHGPDEVRLSLSHSSTINGTPRVSVDVSHADTHETVLQLDLSPEQFTQLLAGRIVTVRSSARVPRGPGPDCQETESSHGDCDGRVREYLVTGDGLLGQLTGEAVLLCRGHAQYHGRKIRRPSSILGAAQ